MSKCDWFKKTYLFLLEELRKVYKGFNNGRPRKLSLETMLFITFIYFKQYITFRQLSFYFNVSASTICRSINYIEQLLSNILENKNSIQIENDKRIIIDVTEIRIERPKYVQNVYYSGKNKCHTIKIQTAINADSKKIIYFVLDKGSEHDFNIYKNTAEHFDCKSRIYVDKGYYGINKYHNKVLIPKKNKKKIPLNKNELKQNQKINKIRIRIEHVFGVLKRYKILSTRYRNHLQKLNTRFFILASIYNYQLKNDF